MAKPCIINHDAFAVDTPQSAYWAGFLMADGCVHKPTYRAAKVSLCLAVKDTRHVEKFKAFLGCSNKVWYVPSVRASGIVATSPKIVADLARFGVVPKKSLTAVVPDKYKNNIDYLRGILDGDGGVDTNGQGHVRVRVCGTISVTTTFIDFYSKYQPSQKVPYSVGNIFSADLQGRAAVRLLHDLYTKTDTSIALERKQQLAKALINNYIMTTCDSEVLTEDLPVHSRMRIACRCCNNIFQPTACNQDLCSDTCRKIMHAASRKRIGIKQSEKRKKGERHER